MALVDAARRRGDDRRRRDRRVASDAYGTRLSTGDRQRYVCDDTPIGERRARPRTCARAGTGTVRRDGTERAESHRRDAGVTCGGAGAEKSERARGGARTVSGDSRALRAGVRANPRFATPRAGICARPRFTIIRARVGASARFTAARAGCGSALCAVRHDEGGVGAARCRAKRGGGGRQRQRGGARAREVGRQTRFAIKPRRRIHRTHTSLAVRGQDGGSRAGADRISRRVRRCRCAIAARPA